MPTASTSLSNCYTPFPTGYQKAFDSSNRHSGDGTGETRSSKAIRRLCLDRSILSSSSGSSLVELGHTKVICSVHGPRPSNSSSISGGAGGAGDLYSSGSLNCEIRYAPNFGIRPETTLMTTATNLDGFGASSGGGFSAEEVEISSRLFDAISTSIPLELLRKSVLDVYVLVLQSDGSILPASIMAASLALSDAGVELYDLVAACSVAVLPREISSVEEGSQRGKGRDKPYHLLTDPTEEEILKAESVITVAILPNWKEVAFWDQSGRLPVAIASEATELCRDGCTAMHKFMRQCLVGN